MKATQHKNSRGGGVAERISMVFLVWEAPTILFAFQVDRLTQVALKEIGESLLLGLLFHLHKEVSKFKAIRNHHYLNEKNIFLDKRRFGLNSKPRG